MTVVTLAAVAAHFGRDLPRCVEKVVGITAAARQDGVDLLVFPTPASAGTSATSGRRTPRTHRRRWIPTDPRSPR